MSEFNVAERQALWQEISSYFNAAEIEAIARETGFVKRKSPLNGLIFFTQLSFQSLQHGHVSLEQLQSLPLGDSPPLSVSRQAWHQRFEEKGVKFMQAMMQRVLELRLPALANPLLLQGFARLWLSDSSLLELPEALQAEFPAAGGSGPAAALKVQMGYDWKSHRCFCEVTAARASDTALHSQTPFWQAGDLVLRDLGYFSSAHLAEIVGAGAFYLSRCNRQVILYESATQQRLKLSQAVARLPKDSDSCQSVAVFFVHEGRSYPARLLIQAVPPTVCEQRLRKLSQRARRRGHAPEEETRLLCGFNLFLTNAAEEQLPAPEVRTLYRLRWQIELLFKSWKSTFALERFSGRKKNWVLCWLYAKLAGLLLLRRFVLALHQQQLGFQRSLSLMRAEKWLQGYAQIWGGYVLHVPEKLGLFFESIAQEISKHCQQKSNRNRKHHLDLIYDSTLA